MKRGADLALSVGLLVTAAALSLATRAHFPTEWDSAQLALGVERFDVRVHEPHPPGYWLYVLAGRAVSALTTLHPHAALLVVSALGAGCAAFAAYWLGRTLGGAWLGASLGALFVVHPMVWFYGSIVATYTWDAAAACAAVALAVRAARASPDADAWRWAAACAATIGVLGGFRPSLIVFLAPVALVAALLAKASLRQLLAVAASGIAGIAVWLVPMSLDQPGGVSVLRRENGEMWSNAARFTSPLFDASAHMVEANVTRSLGWTVASILPIVPIAVLGVLVPRRGVIPRGAVLLAVVAVVPQVLSSVLVHFGKPGYVLGWLGPLIALLLLPASTATRRWRVVATILVVLAVAFDAHQFLRGEGLLPRAATDTVAAFEDGANDAPFRATRREIERVDADIGRYLSLRDDLDPASTVLIVPAGGEGVRYRQLAYLLPEFEIHYLVDGYDWSVTHERRQRYERDRVVEARGRDIVVVAGSHPDLAVLAADGRAEAFELSGGPRVWLVDPGAVLAGVTLEG